MRNEQEFSPAERDALIDSARQHHADRDLPSVTKMVGNLTRAVVKHVSGGMKKVDLLTYQDRLNMCNECDLRVRTRCTHDSCGCFINQKAWWSSEECPLAKW